MNPLRTIAAGTALLLLTACGSGSDRADAPSVNFKGDSASSIALGPGDVKIVSTNNALVLALVGDSVRMQLSDSLRASVKQELDTAGKDNALASAIVKGVSGIVNSALGFMVQVHVDDIRDVRYENGNIRFDMKKGDFRINMQSHGSSGDATFAEDDAMRFINAVKQRQSEVR